jgi:hypothetical protein
MTMTESLRTTDPAAFAAYMQRRYGSKTPANDKGEAIAEACGHLNNHALPNVLDLLRQLQDLVRYVEIIDTHAGTDPRVARAKQSLRDYRDHLPTTI